MGEDHQDSQVASALSGVVGRSFKKKQKLDFVSEYSQLGLPRWC